MSITTHIALLRAVNVGGTGKLTMSDLKEICLEAGFRNPRTYIASGNLLFNSPLSRHDAKSLLEAKLTAHTGRPAEIIMQTPAGLSEIAASNPYPDAPGNKVVALCLEKQPTAFDLEDVRNQATEGLQIGKRVIYIHFPDGQANSRLTFRALREGTARNMNTIKKLVKMSED